MDNYERLINIIKQQAEIFLLDAGEFFPFGICIGKNNEAIPIAAYIEDVNDRPESQPLIEMLEKGIETELAEGSYIIGALVYDAFVKENQTKSDAIMIRIFENDNFTEKRFKYHIHENHVEFI